MLRSAVALVGLVALAFVSTPARADEAPPAAVADVELGTLLARLDRHASAIEELKKRASYTIRGRMEELDGDGKTTHARELVTKVVATGGQPKWEVIRYLDDGVDKTSEWRKRGSAKPSGRAAKRRDFVLPFLAREQPRYTFALAERDPAAPTRVRVAFTPREAAEDAYKGSAWVDTAAGEVLTMGFSPSKNPSFVEHVDVTVRFDNVTALGRAPSSIVFDARGGFLFIKKRYRGTASLEGATLAR